MRGTRWVALGAVIATVGVSLALTAGPASGQSSSNEKPKATEVGVTDKEIHIAIVADVDTPIAPNIFLGSKDAVEGFAKYMNANGGLAGRKVVVDFYDSKINPNETRNAPISACSNDLAMVGTAAVFIATVTDMVGCKDQAGAVTGLPDIPFVETGVAAQCNTESFPVAIPTLE